MGRRKTPQALNAHAKKRAMERYGLNLNKDARREIAQKIRAEQAELVCKSSNNRSLWAIVFQGETLHVVYDKARRTVCTVLPRDAAEFCEASRVRERRLQADQDLRKQHARQQITDDLAILWNQ